VNILIAESLHPILQQKLESSGFICEYNPNLQQSDFKLIANNFQGIVLRSRLKVPEDFLRTNPQLKFIARLGAGMETIDVSTAERMGITCLNSPEGNRDAVGEHAVGLLLTLFHNIRKADAEIREGHWSRNTNRGYELHGKTIGIVGYGNMGKAFAQRLSGFGVSVLAYDKYKTNFSDCFVTETQLIDIQELADVLSLHVPLTDETEYMIDANFISKFKKPFYLINTARGKVVKTKDLADALKSGKILGAGLDVIEYEESHFDKLGFSELPEAFSYLQKSDNVILTPHIAGRTYESEVKLAEILAEKILAKFQ